MRKDITFEEGHHICCRVGTEEQNLAEAEKLPSRDARFVEQAEQYLGDKHSEVPGTFEDQSMSSLRCLQLPSTAGCNNHSMHVQVEDGRKW